MKFCTKSRRARLTLILCISLVIGQQPRPAQAQAGVLEVASVAAIAGLAITGGILITRDLCRGEDFDASMNRHVRNLRSLSENNLLLLRSTLTMMFQNHIALTCPRTEPQTIVVELTNINSILSHPAYIDYTNRRAELFSTFSLDADVGDFSSEINFGLLRDRIYFALQDPQFLLQYAELRAFAPLVRWVLSHTGQEASIGPNGSMEERGSAMGWIQRCGSDWRFWAFVLGSIGMAHQLLGDAIEFLVSGDHLLTSQSSSERQFHLQNMGLPPALTAFIYILLKRHGGINYFTAPVRLAAQAFSCLEGNPMAIPRHELYAPFMGMGMLGYSILFRYPNWMQGAPHLRYEGKK